jgi:hypothetical protein
MFANRRLLLYRPNIGKFSHLGFATGHQQEDGGLERQPDNYRFVSRMQFFMVYLRPGSDSFAYENPWPKLNGSRLDWMFHDGWRRPLAPDQGGKMVFFH